MKSLWWQVVALIIITLVYRAWFLPSDIIGGDWPNLYLENIAEMSLFPPLWSFFRGNGLGAVNPLLNLDTFQAFSAVLFVQWLNLPWTLVYKIGWFGLFLGLSFFSIWHLWQVIDNRNQWLWLLGAVIYTTNTYILMVTGGGQMGVALSYSLAPIVLASFIKLIDLFNFLGKNPKSQIPNPKQIQFLDLAQDKNSKFKIQNSVIAGLAFGIQLMFDPRIAYITMIAVAIMYMVTLLHACLPARQGYMVKRMKLPRLLHPSLLAVWFVPMVIAGMLNAFWLLPLVALRHNPLTSLGAAYTSIGSLQFLSFADFSHALSLLHPNWPENLFGKTYFLQPEFLVLPILAFASLLFIKNSKSPNLQISFFALLGLFGAFLAKGVNPPFGEIYGWMFEHVPGFTMFRDPTKWYVLVVLSYSILIPLTLQALVDRIRVTQRVWPKLFTFFLLFWLFAHRQAVLGQLGGTFASRTVPQEYLQWKDHLVGETEFFRTLWVPRQQRFAFVSQTHPAMEAAPLFGATDSASILAAFGNPQAPKILGAYGVKYVIIPYDALGEIFLDDRAYSPRMRADIERAMDAIGWLKKIEGGILAVYETPAAQNHFFVDRGRIVETKVISPSLYRVTVVSPQPSTLVFSESYHSGWVARGSSGDIFSQPAEYGLNSFRLPDSGRQTYTIVFEPEKYAVWGRWVSAASVAIVVIVLQLIRRKEA